MDLSLKAPFLLRNMSKSKVRVPIFSTVLTLHEKYEPIDRKENKGNSGKRGSFVGNMIA